MRVCVFDIEIEKPVEEVEGGWAAARMGQCGCSAVVIYDSETLRYHIYDNRMLHAAVDHLNSADMIVSFNGKNFDVPCLEAITGFAINEAHYDILDQIWKTLGSKRFKGWGLGKIAFRTLGLTKTDTGEHAPELCKQGRWGELFDYCLNDVHLTRMLYNQIVQEGFIIDPDGSEFQLSAPVQDELI
jgi:RNase_H superfamily